MRISFLRGSIVCACLVWILFSAMTCAAQSENTYDSLGNAMNQVAHDFKEASPREKLEQGLDVALSQFALTPVLIHIPQAFCAGWQIQLTQIIQTYTMRLASGDSSAATVIQKAQALKNKLDAACDPHDAAPPQPAPKPPTDGPADPPHVPTEAEKQAKAVDDYCALR